MPRTKKEEQELSLYERDFYEEAETKEETIQLVVFRLADEWYGLEILRVKQVVEAKKIAYLPSSPEHIAGIVNLRGDVLSVTDLKRVFGLARENAAPKSWLLVVESGPLETGILADEVKGIAEVPLGKIDPAFATIPSEKAGYIKGTCRIADKLVGILDAEKILTIRREKEPIPLNEVRRG